MKFDNFMTNERNLAKELADKYSPDDPTFAKDLLGILINAAYGDKIDFDNLFGADGAADIVKTFGIGDEDPVTVTKTTTSVGGLPADMGATPEEAEALANNMLGEKPIDLKETDERTNFADSLASASTDEEVRELCAKYGINIDEDDGIGAPEDSDPASDNNLDKLEGKDPKEKNKPPKDFGDTPEEKDLAVQAIENNKSAEDTKKEEKKEEPPKEDKPKEEKKEESKADKPAEDKKDESDDTMKNITSALSDRF